MFKRILLATHGTPGARKAEALAADWARKTGAELAVVSIFNDDWKHMTGDDWLNTSTARMQFASYVEDQVNDEMDALEQRLREQFQGLNVRFMRRSGVVEDELCKAAEETGADIVVLGAYQKKQAPGFKARFENRQLHPQLPCPLLVAP
jgi:nucleotide-binding universal stress UspA family protein